MQWNEPGQKIIEGDIAPEVREFFVQRFVAGWNISASIVDLEKGRTLPSFMRDKDSWCKKVNDRVVEKIPTAKPLMLRAATCKEAVSQCTLKEILIMRNPSINFPKHCRSAHTLCTEHA